MPDVIDTPVPAPAAPVAAPPAPDDTSTLADHESQFGSARPVDSREDSDPSDARGADGRFAPRHRAASQRADAGDVEAINAQTKRIKDAEAKLGADIVRQDGESERVFNLRRRAELLERLSLPATPAEPARASSPAPAPVPAPARRPAQAIPQTFPAYDAYLALEGNAEKTYEDYVDARADWRYALKRSQERADDEAQARVTTHAERIARYQAGVTAAKAKYADWDRVVTAEAAITPTLSEAILASEHAAEIAYYLGQHPDERAALNADTQDYASGAVAPLRRYLDTLVAGQRSAQTPSRTAAATTGSAPAAQFVTLPKPLNPVRTGTIATPETPPGDDDMSLANHEKYFAPKRR